MLKTPGHIIFLHMCTINQDHMMYVSWDMKFNRQNFFVILGSFLPFYSPNSQKKWKFHKYEKKDLEVSAFTTSVPKIVIICFIVPETWHLMDVIVSFQFGLFFVILPL